MDYDLGKAYERLDTLQKLAEQKDFELHNAHDSHAHHKDDNARLLDDGLHLQRMSDKAGDDGAQLRAGKDLEQSKNRDQSSQMMDLESRLK